MTDVGTLPGRSSSMGTGIDNAGQIVGTSGDNSAFLYSNGQITDLGLFSANAINNAGQVVGSNGHAVLYSNGQITDLGTLGYFFSYALAINEIGQVVGSASNPSSPSDARAFIYSGGQMRDLNTLIAPGLGVTLNEATAINNGRQIVANAFGNAYLLTPTAAPVPEPSTLTLFGAMLLGLGACLKVTTRNGTRREEPPSFTRTASRGPHDAAQTPPC